MLTEQQNPKTKNLDALSTEELLRVMNAEDATVATTVREAIPQVTEAVDAAVERLERGGRVFYVGAGTSGRLGVVDAVECVPTFSVPPTMFQGIMAGGEPAFVRSIEGAEDDPDAGAAALAERELSADDIVVGIAASGRTPFVLGALAAAKDVGAATVGVACNVPSPVLEAAEIAIGLPVGPEVLTGSTRLKAGTAQKLTLNMFSTAVMVRLGKVYGNLMVDVAVTNEKLQDRATRIVAQVAGLNTMQRRICWRGRTTT